MGGDPPFCQPVLPLAEAVLGSVGSKVGSWVLKKAEEDMTGLLGRSDARLRKLRVTSDSSQIEWSVNYFLGGTV